MSNHMNNLLSDVVPRLMCSNFLEIMEATLGATLLVSFGKCKSEWSSKLASSDFSLLPCPSESCPA